MFPAESCGYLRFFGARRISGEEQKLLYQNAYTLESDCHTYAVAGHTERQFDVLLGALLVVGLDAPVVHPNIAEGQQRDGSNYSSREYQAAKEQRS